MQAQSGLIRLILDGVLVVLVLGYGLYRIMQRRGGQDFMDGPLLESSDMLGASGLQAMNQGEVSGFKYSLLTNDSGKVMISVQLGHNTGAHIVAFGDKSRLSELVRDSISKKWLTPVALEGDFPDYFQLYCSPDKQIELREFFNPKTMLQFVEFCRAYDFEIFDDTLYISQAQGAEIAGDQTTIVADTEEFLKENALTLSKL